MPLVVYLQNLTALCRTTVYGDKISPQGIVSGEQEAEHLNYFVPVAFIYLFNTPDGSKQ